MKAILHKLQQGFILTTDEKITEGELMLNNGTVIKAGNSTLVNIPAVNGNRCMKVLTQPLDFSELSEEDAKIIGWFDSTPDLIPFPDSDGLRDGKEIKTWMNGWVEGHKEGFQKALELTSDRRFTEEDMRKCYKWAVNNVDADGCLMDDEEVDFKDLLESIPKSWEVECFFVDNIYKILSIQNA